MDDMHRYIEGSPDGQGEDPPVTGVATRRIEPGREEEFEAWEGSEERRRWLDKAEPLVKEQKVGRLTGLETWFTLPSKAGEPAPPRYKMAVVTWIAVFPLATVIFMILQPILGGVPAVLRTLVFTLIMVSTMTYLVMPRMTRLFSFWLYPER